MGIFKAWFQTSLFDCKAEDLTLFEKHMDETHMDVLRSVRLVISHVLIIWVFAGIVTHVVYAGERLGRGSPFVRL